MKPSDPDPEQKDSTESLPKLSFWKAMPKRSLSRILFLVAALLGIIYLQQKTSVVAGCVGDAFRVPAVPSQSGSTRIHGQVAIPQSDGARP